MKKLSLFLLLLSFCSCNSVHYCYIVRHAEKLDSTPYSVLSPIGHQRAGALRDHLNNKKIDLIFATPFKRTQETAQPLAEALNIAPIIYRNNAVDSIVTVLKGNSKRNILLVGHSGNLPAIIEGLTGQKVNPIPESEFDNLYIVKTKRGQIALSQTKY